MLKNKKITPEDFRNAMTSSEDDVEEDEDEKSNIEVKLTEMLNKLSNLIPALMAQYGNDVKILVSEMENLIAKINDGQQKAMNAFTEAIVKEEKPHKKQQWDMIPERDNRGFIERVKIREV